MEHGRSFYGGRGSPERAAGNSSPVLSPGAKRQRGQSSDDDVPSVKRVHVDNQPGLAPSVAQHYNRIEEKGVAERSNSPIVFLRNFNNWVKSMLIHEFAMRLADERVDSFRANVLDLGCGKGGDLLKWKKADIRHLICVDIAETSVEQCRTRYNETKQRNQRERHSQPMFSAEFLAADCTRVRIQPQFRNPDIRLDLVSVQFALHYSFESLPQAERLLDNVADSLQPGGYFIATIPDAYTIMRRAERQASADGDQQQRLHFGNRLFRIKFDKPLAPGERPPLFGTKYDFFLEGVVDCPEFLVYLPLLVRMCEKRGLKLVFRKSFAEMLRAYGRSEEGRPLLARIHALEAFPPLEGVDLMADEAEYEHALEAAADQKCVGTVSRSEWDACSLYMALGFRKNKK